MIRFLRRLFCKHKWGEVIDECPHWHQYCLKCGKRKGGIYLGGIDALEMK